MTTQQATRLVQQCFVDLLTEQETMGGLLPETDDLDVELAEQRGLAFERMAELGQQRQSGKFDLRVTRLARAMAIRRGVNPDSFSAARNADLWDGMSRALIEQQRLFLSRWEDRLARYVPPIHFSRMALLAR